MENKERKAALKKFLEDADTNASFVKEIKKEENKAAASNVDSFLAKGFLEKANDAKRDLKEIKTELSAIKKEEKEETKEAAKKGEVFSKEKESFTKRDIPFKNPKEERFLKKESFVSEKQGELKNGERKKPSETVKKESALAQKKRQKTYSEAPKEKPSQKVTAKEADERFQKPKEEEIKERAARKKELAKAKKKEQRKKARTTAASEALRTKKNMQNDLGDFDEVTGDLIRDGSSGILRTFTQGLKRMTYVRVKIAMSAFLKAVGPMVLALGVPFLMILLVLTLFNGTVSVLSGVLASDAGDDEFETYYPLGDGSTYRALSAQDIDAIMISLYESYNIPEYNMYFMNARKEYLLRYALSKVGCEYNQAKHWSKTDDIFDCSSLAYRAYSAIGYDISWKGIYTAAEECRAMVNGGYQVTSFLLPGDLIFYGGADNDRYKGVYHVAIYVGNGKMVEARNERYGVVYCDFRARDAVVYARVLP